MIYWKEVEERVAKALEQLRSTPDRGKCTATLVGIADHRDVGVTADHRDVWRLDLEIRVTKLLRCWFWKVNLVATRGSGKEIEVHYPLIAYEEPKTKVVVDTGLVVKELRTWLQCNLNELGEPVKPRVSRHALRKLRKMVEKALTQPLAA